jgi:hypothetical protein
MCQILRYLMYERSTSLLLTVSVSIRTRFFPQELVFGERTVKGSMLGGAAAGVVMGASAGKASVLWPMVGVCSVAMGLFEFNGHTFSK